jgi:hypothetical protein
VADMCAWLPAWLPNGKKARYREGNGPVSWARSEGLEPPTF